MTDKEKLLKMMQARGEIAPLEDGYQRYWPSSNGALSAYVLRLIADILDELVVLSAPDYPLSIVVEYTP